MIEALLQYEFMQRALIVSLLAPIACGIVGVYVIVRKMVFISGGISHASFGGVGLGFYLGVNPILTALVFTIASALGMGIVTRRTRLPEDTSIGIMWAVGMAIGIVFLGLSSGYHSGPFSYLIGDILLVSTADLILIAVLDVIVILTVILLYKEFTALSFDEEFGIVVGAPMGLLYFVLLCLIAITVVALIKVVGIILVITLLTVPALMAKQYTHTLWRMMILAVIFGVVFTTLGLWLSYELDVASGATIILTSVALIPVCLSLSRVRNRRRECVDAPPHE